MEESRPSLNIAPEIRREAEKDLRQQKKIILYFETPKGEGEDYLFGKRPLPKDEDISLLKEAFFSELSRGEIPDEEFREMLQLINAPSAAISRGRTNKKAAKTAESFFSRPEVDNKRVRGLLAAFVRGNFKERNSVETQDLVAFAEKYPDPVALEKDLSRFLDLIQRNNGVGKRKEYEQALSLFQKEFYGKRWQYYQQINRLKEKAGTRVVREESVESDQFIGAVENRLSSPLELETRNGWIVAGTDEGVGYKRVNEDGIAINTEKEAFVSIDGVGGKSGGREAKDILSEAFLVGIKDDRSFRDIQRQAHLAMKERGQGAACYVAGRIVEDYKGAVLEVAQAGDERLVVLDERGIKFATKDENNPKKKNKVFNFVGYNYQGKTTVYRLRLSEGDRIIAASDGLWDNFPSQEVYRLVKGKSPQEAMAILNKKVKRAMASGGKRDNLNIIIYDFRPDEKEKKES